MRNRFAMMTGWQRLLCGAVLGAVVSFGLPLFHWPVDDASRGLLGWCVAAAAYLLPAWWLAETSDAERTRSRAQQLDQPQAWILVIMLVAVGVGAGVIAMLLQEVPQLCGAQRVGHIALGLAGLASSWLMMHTIYAFHYAHRYYQRERKESEKGTKAEPPGLKFPGKSEPDYFDFLYYSFVVGMTSQVSDVQVISREMRRITLIHGVLAFTFNMLVLALSINVVASSMQGSAPVPSGSPTAEAAQSDQTCR
jgi:uncharacterized membrane protein